jgi:putative ABC transport system substrate-binding protein
MNVRRREFITLLGGAAVAWPLAARAQQPSQMKRVGVLMNGVATDLVTQSYVAAFERALNRLGWSEGQNVRIDVRWNAGDAELARVYGAQLIGLMPDVILASSTTNLTVIRQATRTIPVVFLQVTDPVAQGFVANMTKPGGNITGFAQTEFSVGGKWLGLLKEIAPGLARIAIMFNPETSPQSAFYVPAVEAAAHSLGVQVTAIPVHATADITPALESFVSQPNGGLILPPDTFTRLRGKLIADLATHHRLPMISANEHYVEQGQLLYYGISQDNSLDQFKRAAGYIDRILMGAKAGDLPVQNPDKYTLIINLKTAKSLGLTVPQNLLAIADEVIE